MSSEAQALLRDPREEDPLVGQVPQEIEIQSNLKHTTQTKFTWRATVWFILHYRSSIAHTSFLERLSYTVEVVILNLILLNVVFTIWGSMVEDPENSVFEERWYSIFLYFSTVVFTVEYLLRLWSCLEDRRYKVTNKRGPIKGRLKWMIMPMSVLDLVALFPFYLEMFLDNSSTKTHSYRGAMTIRGLRLLRILSFLRIERSYNAVKKLRKIFRRKREELLIVTYTSTVLIICCATTMFFLEHDAQPTVFPNIAASAWWTIETITSLGYGDAIPVTSSGKVFASLVALFGIILFSIPGAVLGSGFIEVMLEHQKQREVKERGNFIKSLQRQREENFSLYFGQQANAVASTPGGRRRKIRQRKSVPITTPVSPIASTSDQVQEPQVLNNDMLIYKFNQLIENQQLLELQLQCQQEQLSTVIELLQSHLKDKNGSSRSSDSSD